MNILDVQIWSSLQKSSPETASVSTLVMSSNDKTRLQHSESGVAPQWPLPAHCAAVVPAMPRFTIEVTCSQCSCRVCNEYSAQLSPMINALSAVMLLASKATESKWNIRIKRDAKKQTAKQTVRQMGLSLCAIYLRQLLWLEPKSSASGMRNQLAWNLNCQYQQLI